MFILPAVAGVWRICQGVGRPPHRAPARGADAVRWSSEGPGIRPAGTAGGSRPPASGLRRAAGLGREGTGSGGRRVSTCQRISESLGKERPLGQGTARATQKSPGAPAEPRMVSSTFSPSLLFQTRPQSFERPWLAVPLPFCSFWTSALLVLLLPALRPGWGGWSHQSCSWICIMSPAANQSD